ncbi:MAG: ribonuclease R, partial [Candidatus Electrothrix sp. MAN1_4]|nr:ribonuclease R [Candidatus Electrothrix sp. MAN1_4]
MADKKYRGKKKHSSRKQHNRAKEKAQKVTGKEKPVRATLSLTAKGFGFAVLEGNVAREQKDIFIPASALNGATHGDTVLVQ